MNAISKAKYCPACKQMVEFSTIPAGMGIVHRCNNCWAHYENAETLPDEPQRRKGDPLNATNPTN